jgi:hypothetical protein
MGLCDLEGNTALWSQLGPGLGGDGAFLQKRLKALRQGEGGVRMPACLAPVPEMSPDLGGFGGGPLCAGIGK